MNNIIDPILAEYESRLILAENELDRLLGLLAKASESLPHQSRIALAQFVQGIKDHNLPEYEWAEFNRRYSHLRSIPWRKAQVDRYQEAYDRRKKAQR